MTAGKVLIVEDNPVNLRLAQFLLEKKGFTVRKSGSGAECLAEMTRELPDIVLMDIQLPGEDGLAITRKIRSDARMAGSLSLPSPPTRSCAQSCTPGGTRSRIRRWPTTVPAPPQLAHGRARHSGHSWIWRRSEK